MSFVLADRVKELSTTTGTGTLDLAGAVDGFQTFVAGVGDTNVTYYCIYDRANSDWEVGLGTVTDASPDTLSRTTILASTNSGSAVDLGTGTKEVFCTRPADCLIWGLERSSDPPEPAEGQYVIWLSDGTQKGDDGDIMIASKAGGNTKYGTLFDHSGGSAW